MTDKEILNIQLRHFQKKHNISESLSNSMYVVVFVKPKSNPAEKYSNELWFSCITSDEDIAKHMADYPDITCPLDKSNSNDWLFYIMHKLY